MPWPGARRVPERPDGYSAEQNRGDLFSRRHCGHQAAAELEAKANPKRKELEQKQNEVNSLQDQLNKGQNTLSDAAKAELYKNIEFKKKALQRDYEDRKSVV